jgi:hypothetical protein
VKSQAEKSDAKSPAGKGDGPAGKPKSESTGDKNAGTAGAEKKGADSAAGKPQPGEKPGGAAKPEQGGAEAKSAKPEGSDQGAPKDRGAEQKFAPGDTGAPEGAVEKQKQGQAPAKQTPDGKPQPGAEQATGQPGAQPGVRPAKGENTPKTGAREPQTGKPESGEKTGEKTGETPDQGAAPGPSGERPDGTGAPEHPDAFGQGNTPAPRTENKTPSSEPGSAPDSPKREPSLGEKLDNLDKLLREAQQHQKVADELRERSKDLLEHMSPQERQRMERWDREMARERGRAHGPGDSTENIAGDTPADDNHSAEPAAPLDMQMQPVDARTPPRANEPSEKARVIGNVYSKDKATPGVSSGMITEESLAHVRESAQKAIEDRSVPGRYSKLLGRYFKRLPDAAPLSRPAPEAAPDAEPGGKR